MTFLVCCCSIFVRAQDIDTTKRLIVEKRTIYYEDDEGVYGAKLKYYFKYTENKEWKKVGVYGGKFKPFIQHNKKSFAQFKRFRNKRLWGDVVLVGSVVAVIPIMLAWTPMGSFILMGVVAMAAQIVKVTATHNLYRSEEIYNERLPEEKKKP